MKRVVVTGLGAVTPIGNNVADFWEGLKTGKNGIGMITRFDVSESKYKLAAEVKDFDPLCCMDKLSAKKLDRFTQYALASAAEAMADSELEGKIAPEELGVYFGSGIGGFETFGESYKALEEKGPRRVSPLFIPKMISNIAAGNIAIKYHAQGPCVSMTTACATGTTCIGEAYRAIRHGYTTAAICGGSEAAITNLAVAGFGACMALSPSEDPNAASLPFDKRRGGFVMGEGAGCLVLESLTHAQQRGATILAEVAGYGASGDAYHITSPSPDGEAAAHAIRGAIEDAGLTPADVDYINAHGTSTPLNEKYETIAIKKAFGDEAYNVKVSSTKSMTGHLLGGAAAVEAIACVMAIREGIVPPTIGYKEPDPECDLDITPNKAVEMPINVAISNSLGFGGHNACILIKKV